MFPTSTRRLLLVSALPIRCIRMRRLDDEDHDHVRDCARPGADADTSRADTARAEIHPDRCRQRRRHRRPPGPLPTPAPPAPTPPAPNPPSPAPLPPAKRPGGRLAVSPQQLTVERGVRATFIVTLQSIDGFRGDVSLFARILPDNDLWPGSALLTAAW